MYGKDPRDTALSDSAESLRVRYDLENIAEDRRSRLFRLADAEGILPTDKGGTGVAAENFAGLKIALGVASLPLCLENGGLGSENTSVHEARSSLGMSKSLWSGAWSGGNLTVPGFSDYTLFEVSLTDRGSTVLAVAYNGYFRGIGGFVSVAPSIYTYAIAATYSGNTLSWVDARNVQMRASNTNSAYTSDVINGIYGLL